MECENQKKGNTKNGQILYFLFFNQSELPFFCQNCFLNELFFQISFQVGFKVGLSLYLMMTVSVTCYTIFMYESFVVETTE